MAITRKFLKALGIEDDKAEQIIEEHTTTVERIRAEVETYKADAEKLPGVQAELNAVKNDGYKSKYEKEHADFEAYKADISAKETKTAKTAAVRKYFEGKGITGKSLDIAMRGAGAEIEAAELDGDDLKDTTALDTLVQGDFAGLVGKTEIKGANVAHPPVNNSGATLTRAEIYAKDERGRYVMNTSERQKALETLIISENKN